MDRVLLAIVLAPPFLFLWGTGLLSTDWRPFVLGICAALLIEGIRRAWQAFVLHDVKEVIYKNHLAIGLLLELIQNSHELFNTQCEFTEAERESCKQQLNLAFQELQRLQQQIPNPPQTTMHQPRQRRAVTVKKAV